jgi:hypothetical protein
MPKADDTSTRFPAMPHVREDLRHLGALVVELAELSTALSAVAAANLKARDDGLDVAVRCLTRQLAFVVRDMARLRDLLGRPPAVLCASEGGENVSPLFPLAGEPQP